jgi:hypothetical protein
MYFHEMAIGVSRLLVLGWGTWELITGGRSSLRRIERSMFIISLDVKAMQFDCNARAKTILYPIQNRWR